MIRSIHLIIVFVMIACMLFGQNRRKREQTPKADKPLVPLSVEQKFAIEHPDVTAQWRKDGEFFKALFVNPVNNLGYIIVYDRGGKVVRREKELEMQEYPVSIRDHQEKKFPGEGMAVWSSTDSTGNVLFYSQKNNSIYWFDRYGVPLNAPADSLNPAIR